MQELQAIIKALGQLQQPDQSAAIATVVSVSGSTYRQPGARMLITSEGQSVGIVSGGCLEKDVIERGQQVIISGKPVLVSYDTTHGYDIVWGLGLGCSGVIRILIEPINLNHDNEYLEFLSMCLQQRQSGVLATIFSVEGQTKLRVGDRLMLHLSQAVTSTIEEPALVQTILTDAYDVLQTQRYISKPYLLPDGVAEVFIETIQPITSIIIFGSGHNIIPVARLSNLLGWHTTVIDTRCLEISRERFSDADKVVLARPDVSCQQVELDSHTIALVMTHNYLHDQEILRNLLPSPARYVGVLGSKQRINRLLESLYAENIFLTNAQLNRLHSPIGIDIGANTPEEIALSIVSEIQAVIAGRTGGFLKDRKEPIHSRIEDKTQLNTTYVDGILMDI